ncbi:MAG TPA: copper resistance CopC family protein [Actinomycetota bacterium]|nr:copper resistance CopC family protein [Actinomycetota bacterium]
MSLHAVSWRPGTPSRAPVRRYAVAVLSAGSVLAFAAGSPASAHAEYRTSVPSKGANVNVIPRTIVITFSEPPAASAAVEILDGCERDVTGVATASNLTLETEVTEGEPGRWMVDYSVVSAVDGHRTNGRFAFTVEGEPDCVAAPGTDDPVRDRTDEGGGDFPVIWIALGTIGLIAIAYAVRRFSL